MRARRWKKRLLFATVTLVAVSGIGFSFRHSDLKFRHSDLELDLSPNVKAHMQEVFDILVDDKNSYTVYCSHSTYALCALASCKTVAGNTSACGCKMYTDELGEFGMNHASSMLIRSVTYRDAVLLYHANNTEQSETKICAALRDGSIWAEAGYGATSFGSFYHPTKSSSSTAEVEGTDSSGEHGSCMGSPCTSLNWDEKDGCSVTCLCPDYRESGVDDTDDAGCFRSVFGKGELLAWTSTLDAVLDYTTQLAQLLDTIDHKKLEEAGKCDACTVD